MAGRPLDELDPVPVRIVEPGRSRSFWAARQLGWAWGEAEVGQRRERFGEVINLDCQVVEAANLDRSRVGPVDQFQGGHWLVGKFSTASRPPSSNATRPSTR